MTSRPAAATPPTTVTLVNLELPLPVEWDASREQWPARERELFAAVRPTLATLTGVYVVMRDLETGARWCAPAEDLAGYANATVRAPAVEDTNAGQAREKGVAG